MTKQVQRRRGTDTQHTSFTGAEGEISVNTTNKSVHVHDGATAGGIEAARADLGNVSDADLNSALTGNTLSSLTVTSADINGGTIDGTVIGGSTPAAGNFTNITATGTVEGRDVAADGSKLDGIETNADVTDTANVTAAGALMDSELTDITAVKALDQGVATTDSPTFAGLTTTGDVSFGDNDKAIFGAGSDLQIYHDGSNSVIKDNGTGNLLIQGATDVVLEDTSGANYFRGVSGSYVRLYHNNDTKLETTSTGIDVTGTVTADGLTVDGESLLQFSNNGKVTFRAASATDETQMHVGTNNSGALNISTRTLGSDVDRIKLANNGDISFYEDTGSTPKMVWKAADERLGIGIASPSKKMHVSQSYSAPTGGHDGSVYAIVSNSGSANNYTGLELSSGNNGGSFIHFGDTDDANVGALSYFHNGNYMRFDVNASEAMRIDSSGNLLVGTTSTGFSAEGHVFRAGDYASHTVDNDVVMVFNRTTSDGGIVQFRKDGSTVGSIGVSGRPYFANNAGDSIMVGDNGVLPRNGTGGSQSGVINLGGENDKWKDLYLSGGVYLGGTTSANKLDDYEEGTWTPTSNGITTDVTINVLSATYTKIGRSVTVQLYVAFPGTTSATQLQIGGFPFTSIGSNQYSVSVINHNTGAGEKILRMSPNNTVAFGLGFNNASVAFSAFNGSIFITSMTYTTS